MVATSTYVLVVLASWRHMSSCHVSRQGEGRDQCYVTMRPMYETTFAFAYEHVCMYSYVTCFYYNAAT